MSSPSSLSEQKERPKVGVGVVVIKDDKVLLGKRKNSHGDGSWCFPGGHLEMFESPESCAIREVKEETGMKIKNIRQGTFTNDFFRKEGKHYITIFMISEHASGEPKLMEPEKCEEWRWFDWNNLPNPLFVSTENFVKSGYNPFN